MIVVGVPRLEYADVIKLGAGSDFSLDPDSRSRVASDRSKVDRVLEGSESVYGINTGFGYLSCMQIAPEHRVELQLALLRSHACGVGSYLPLQQARSLLALKLHCFLLGGSGVSPECVDVLEKMLRSQIVPAVPHKGSLGASGDLAPLAHLGLALIGEGDVFLSGELVPAGQAFEKAGLAPLQLKPKEGLSLINGTQFMATLACYSVHRAVTLLNAATAISAVSLVAFSGQARAFDHRINQLRPHPGQTAVANYLRQLLDEVKVPVGERVQDPYSFRCTPQVHGATADVVGFSKDVVNREINSVTDNPLVLQNGEIISGGNFHGQPLAYVADFLAIAVAELGSISERRTNNLISPGVNKLTAFLAVTEGLNSGFMVPHYVAAACASENKVLAHPASVDSIPTSAGQEDHVSMGATALTKLARVEENVSTILAIELLAGIQALDIKEYQCQGWLKDVREQVRGIAPFMVADSSLHKAIEEVAAKILAVEFSFPKGGLDH